MTQEEMRDDGSFLGTSSLMEDMGEAEETTLSIYNTLYYTAKGLTTMS